ncbi:MAG: hypothetical protein LUO89_00510 [Methanothrix sp.]|jgi:hypothetical protein|nr:hypothetical protein [Methanothrix sp.]
MIKMGIESSATKLHDQLLLHPERYFFILVMEERGALCLKTCSACGNDIEIKEIDGLILDDNGNLISIFHEELQEVLMKRESFLRYLEGEQYPISSAIRKKIKELPGFIDWIMASVPIRGRCLMLYPSWNIEHSDWEVLKSFYL